MFRKAQLGALFSLAGHLQTAKEPVQAVLPTGVGKTAVICALPFMVETRRVLVVVPTTLLRDQIADELSTFRTLASLGAIDFEERPKVQRVDHKLGTSAAWSGLNSCDVAVGTPMVLSAEIAGVAVPPRDLFDLVIFDEAHHVPATTWDALLSQHGRRAALLTATPFRRDRRALPGSLVYHYSLREAMEDGVYAPVTYVPVRAREDDDEPVANVAIERIESDEHRTDGSLLLVRTDRVIHAKELVDLYARKGIQLGLITSQHSLRHAQNVIGELRNGTLRGVVSVGALVEGFDMPRLKVAAYHRPHRTLPATLQFVGRIARVTGGTAPAELVAAQTERLTYETSELYQEDATAWSTLLPELADAAVKQEQAARTYIAEADVETAREDLSAAAIRPRRYTRIFDVSSCPALNIGADIRLSGLGITLLDFKDVEARLRAVVLQRTRHPEWMATRTLDSQDFNLLLFVHNAEKNLLFLTGPTRSALNQVLQEIGAEDARRIPPNLLARYLQSRQPQNYSSVGLRAGRAPGARLASYRTLAGSAVEGAITDTESRSSALGHVIGRRLDEGQSTGMGVSLAGAKIWETEACASLLEFRDWCDELADLLAVGAANSVPLLDRIPLQRTLIAFPERVVTAVMDNRLLHGGYRALVEDTFRDLNEMELVPIRLSARSIRLDLRFEDTPVWSGRLSTNGAITTLGDDRIVEWPDGGEHTVDETLTEFEPYLYFADGSSSVGDSLFTPSPRLPDLSPGAISSWDWSNCSITDEATPNLAPRLNVQEATVKWACEQLTNAIVLFDHGKGEIADVVAIERPDATKDVARVHLLHCKGSSTATPGHRLDDLVEVMGQAVRSARWSTPKSLFVELDRRMRERPNLRVLCVPNRREVERLLKVWAANPPELLEFHVWAVQPGIAANEVEGWTDGKTITVATEEWCGTQGARFTLAASP
jgi:superfamily II DNA or RNA helicase